MKTQHTQDNAKQAIKTAMEMVSALCQPKGTEGARNWTMSIPARRDYDPDLVIANGLRLAKEEIERLDNHRDELQKSVDFLDGQTVKLQQRHDELMEKFGHLLCAAKDWKEANTVGREFALKQAIAKVTP